MFKELFERNSQAYDYDIHGAGNKYKDFDKNKLKGYIKSFNIQISDLRRKAQQASLGSGGDRKGYFEEITNLNLKIAQAEYILRGK